LDVGFPISCYKQTRGCAEKHLAKLAIQFRRDRPKAGRSAPSSQRIGIDA
jgi:hypothetical protein